MKHIKRFFTAILVILIAYVVINYNTSFFTDISTTVPYLEENYPELAHSISSTSKRINSNISQIPTPRELLARFQNKELPIDPEDVAQNIYYSSNSMLNFYGKRNISVVIDGDIIDVYGISDKESDKYIVYRFLDESGESLRQEVDVCDNDGEFRKQIRIPDNAYQFTVFTGPEQYGDYESIVYDYIYLSKVSDGNWSIKDSPVFESNVEKFEKAKSKSNALADTFDVHHTDGSIISQAKSITKGIENDYNKAVAIHDWICENIYYDSDSIEGASNTAPYIASDVLKTRRAVCLGYANLYAAMCRSLDIPCNVVTGYALGVGSADTEWNAQNTTTTEANHAWNEVYLDSRWVIVDTTWDCKNKITDGKAQTDKNISHLFFDSNLKFFSTNHRITEYLR